MDTATSLTKERAPFRLDVQGLRAVASLLIASYHIWFGTVSGGVDVFFLLGGFLLTTSLLGELERTGRVDVLAGLRRQAKRLLPMAGLVIIVASILAVVLRPWALLKDTALDMLAAATFWENWRLAASAVAYVDAGHDKSIVQHFWAMSVQGQWTLACLATLAVIGLLVRARRARLVVGIVFSVLTIASFAYATIAIAHDQNWAYFDTGARAWELFLGGGVAVVARYVHWSRIVRIVVGGIGLLVIVLAGLLPSDWPQPGPVTLVPTLAAAGILLAGSNAGDGRVGVGRLLAVRPLVWIGSFSYGLYLWHWVVLWTYVTVGGEAARSIGILDGGLVLVVSILIAWATHRGLRMISRREERTRSVPRTAWMIPAVATVSIAAIVAAPALVAEDPAVNVAPQAEPGGPLPPGAAPATVEEQIELITEAVDDPQPPAEGFTFGEESRGPEWTVDGCVYVLAADLDECRWEPTGPSTAEIWVVGDSRATSWLPGIRAAVQDFATVQAATFPGCLFADGPWNNSDHGENCLDHQAMVTAEINERQPDLVVVAFGAW